MYLSRVALDQNRRETMEILSSPHMIHGMIEQSFKGDRQRNLWRIDWLGGICYLLVLSKEKPDFTNINEKYGYIDPEKGWESKNYEKLLDRLETGQVWRFRLCANPVRSSNNEKNVKSGRGKVFAHVTEEQQKQWLIAKSRACGFQLKNDEFDIIERKWKKFSKNKGTNQKVSVSMATYQGLLTITDSELFQKNLVLGIGKAKAYGCGLLTIVQASESDNE